MMLFALDFHQELGSLLIHCHMMYQSNNQYFKFPTIPDFKYTFNQGDRNIRIFLHLIKEQGVNSPKYLFIYR